MAEGLTAADLRRSIDGQHSRLRPASAAASLRSSYADGLPAEAEAAAAWAASQGGSVYSLAADGAAAGASTAAWDAAAVPPAAAKKRGLWAKLTSKPKLH